LTGNRGFAEAVSFSAAVLQRKFQIVDGQQIILRTELEVKGVRRPVRWACHEPTNPDGSLPAV